MVRTVTPKRSAKASAVTPVRRPRRYSARAKSRSVLCISTNPDIPLTARVGKLLLMNAGVRRLNAVLEPLRLELPDAALRRLRLRLGRALSTGEALEVGLAYGVDPDELGRLVEYWRNDFELE